MSDTTNVPLIRIDDVGQLNVKMEDLLTRIANALKGDPDVMARKMGYAGMMHSWHDLPQLVQELQNEVVRLREALRLCEAAHG